MKVEEFNKLLDRRLGLIKQVLAVKAGEYASAYDRLHNFKYSANITKETPEQVCVGFFVKHLTSLLDLVNVSIRPVIVQGAIDEKIGDLINYLILLEALLSEDA